MSNLDQIHNFLHAFKRIWQHRIHVPFTVEQFLLAYAAVGLLIGLFLMGVPL